jgi:hypothetical protein
MRRMIATFLSVCALMLVCASVRAEDNPGYTQWAKYKPGTCTTVAMTSDAGGQSSKMETKSTLAEVTPDKVVIDVVTSMEAGGQKMDMPAQKMEIKKAMDATPAPDAETQKQIDAAKANSKTSDETVTVAGGTFKAKLTESSMEANGMKTTSKVWTSDEVPGGMVKMEATTDGAMKSTTKSELKSFDKK